MKNSRRRVTLTFGAAASGLLAAALLPMAVAFADEYDLEPFPGTFEPTQVEGYPPLINIETGSDTWYFFDKTPGSENLFPAGVGTDTETTFGAFTNDDYLQAADSSSSFTDLDGTELFVGGGTQIDLANFGAGFGNEWIDLPSGPEAGVSDLFITPFGDYEVLGSFFSVAATVIG